MKVFLYFVVYTMMLVGVFVTMVYLMTLVDPNLRELPAKAAKMMKGINPLPVLGQGNKDNTLMVPENYVDYQEYVKKKYTH